MNAQQPNPVSANTPDGWGAPGTPNPGTPAVKAWTRKRGLAAAAAALLLAVGAGGLALTASPAASSGSAAADEPGGAGGQGIGPGTGPGQGTQEGATGGRQGQGGAGGFAADGIAGTILASIHAEYVVIRDGDYVTQFEQSGTVTDISSGEITVESSDGFTRVYTLGGDIVVGSQQLMGQQASGSSASQLSVADIEAGSAVRIVADADGSGYAANSIIVMAMTAGQGN